MDHVNLPPALTGREQTFLPKRDRLFIENSAPRSKAVLGFDYTHGAWSPSLKVIYFGAQTLGTFTGTIGGVPNQQYRARTSADVSLTYAFSERAKLTAGVSNMLDVFPSSQDPNETEDGRIFESVQFGLNGRA